MLTNEGQEFRKAIAEAGVELTPDELDDSIVESIERVMSGYQNCPLPKEMR